MEDPRTPDMVRPLPPLLPLGLPPSLPTLHLPLPLPLPLSPLSAACSAHTVWSSLCMHAGEGPSPPAAGVNPQVAGPESLKDGEAVFQWLIRWGGST